jgi:hypothetical protein
MPRGIQGETLRVKGLRDLQRAFALADKTLAKELRGKIRDAAEPVRADAEGAAVSRIRNIGIPWSRMRVGSTATGAYVAPKKRAARGRGNVRRRPNLADLMMGRAMLPALQRNQADVVRNVNGLLGEIERDWAAVGGAPDG